MSSLEQAILLLQQEDLQAARRAVRSPHGILLPGYPLHWA